MQFLHLGAFTASPEDPKYIDGIEQERNVLANKVKSGTSSFGQILSDIFGSDSIRSKSFLDESLRNWSGMSVREMAREVDTENNYETLYWVASAFVHSHVLSVIDSNQIIRQNLGIMGNIFSLDTEGLIRETSLISMAGPAINILISLNSTFTMGIDEEIDKVKLAQKYAYSKTFGEDVEFRSDLKPGELLVRNDSTGTTKLYSPKKQPKRSTSKRHKR